MKPDERMFLSGEYHLVSQLHTKYMLLRLIMSRHVTQTGLLHNNKKYIPTTHKSKNY